MGFLVNLFAANPENPRFSLNDPAAWDALGVQPSSSGVNVNAETALTHSPWWRGVNLLANDVAKLPLYVYQRKGDAKEKANKHPAYKLLLRKPNEYQTAGVWKKQMMGHALSRGNGYSYIVRNKAGEPMELLPLGPDVTYPVRENGVLWYVTKAGNEERKLAAEDVFHLKGFSFDGLCGYSVIDKARETLGLGLGERKHQAIFFRNSARPSIILMHPGVLPDKTKEELRSSWERMQSGLENAHRTAVLDRGLTAKDISFNAVDSQLLESRRFDLTDVANFLCIPSHKLGDKAGQAYNSLEQENQGYLDSGLDPWLVAIEEEAWDKLLTEEEKDDDTVEALFDRRKLIRANLTDRTNYWSKALGGQPWRTVEEARLDDDENPEPDVGEIQKPMNMAPPGGPPGGPGDDPAPSPNGPPKRPPAPSEPAAPPRKKKPKDGAKAAAKAQRKARLRAAHAGLLMAGVARITRRIGVHAERAAKDAKGWTAWVEGFEAEHRGVTSEIILSLQSVCSAAGILERPAGEPWADKWLLDALKTEFAALADRATAKTLAGECAALVADQAVRLPKAAAKVFLGYSPDQQRDDAGRFGSGGGGEKKEHEDKAKGKFADSLRADKKLPNERRQEYYQAAKGVFGAMPERALDRYNAHTAGQRFHADGAELTATLAKEIPGLRDKMGVGNSVGGAYNRGSRMLELDGGAPNMSQSTREIYAHEFTHAVDGPTHELSKAAGWQAAYAAEIGGGRLSAYAKKSASEGFAEFGRAVYGGKAERAKIEKHFPLSAKYFKEQGLW